MLNCACGTECSLTRDLVPSKRIKTLVALLPPVIWGVARGRWNVILLSHLKDKNLKCSLVVQNRRCALSVERSIRGHERTNRPRCPLCEADAPGEGQETGTSITPGWMADHRSAAPPSNTPWQVFPAGLLAVTVFIFFLLSSITFLVKMKLFYQMSPKQVLMKLVSVGVLLLFPNLPLPKEHVCVGRFFFFFFWEDCSDLWIKLVPRTRNSQVLFWKKTCVCPGMSGFVNYLSVKWRLYLPMWDRAKQIKVLFLLTSGGEVYRHGNITAISLIFQLLLKSLISVGFAAVCIFSFASSHWLFSCFTDTASVTFFPHPELLFCHSH